MLLEDALSMHLIVKELITGCDGKKKDITWFSKHCLVTLVYYGFGCCFEFRIVLFIHAEHVALE